MESFKKNIIRDFKKYLECEKNNIKVVYYCSKYNLNGEYIGEIYSEFDDILNKIKIKKKKLRKNLKIYQRRIVFYLISI